jgi:hypothetical protein
MRTAVHRPCLLPVILWALMLAAVLAWPDLANVSDPGDSLTRNTVRLALLWYGIAALLMLLLRPDEWDPLSSRARVTRCCWTLACMAYLIHVGFAFHYHHGWSHARAIEHVRTVSGVGEGLYVSYLFTVLWVGDVLWWWFLPASYARRPVWVGYSLHGFMFFMIFNATVVYETGPIRWSGLALTDLLGRQWALRSACRSAASQATKEEHPAA